MNAKRVLSLLMSVLLILGMIGGISLSANAADAVPALPDGTVFVNLTWTEANLPASTTVNGKTFTLTWGTNAFAVAQDGLDAATAGGTVYLFPGEYAGFTIKKNLNVLGAKYGINPNVKGTKETDLWTKNASRGTNETIITGNISVGVSGATVYHVATDMTIDGVMLQGEGQIRSNAAAKNNNGLVKITLKNFYIKDSTKTTAPLYLQPYYGMSAATDNQYRRDVTIENVRVEGQTQKELMVLTADKADISGLYMHTDCTQIFFSTASAATGYTSEVEWNIHDNMFANPVGRVIYVDSQNAKGNSQSLVSDLDKRSKVTFNFEDNIFVNSFVASGTNSAFTLAFRPATQNVYLNFDGNVFYNTEAPGSGHSCIAGYATVTGNYSDQITITNNKMIGKIVNGFSFGQIGGSIDVSGNYTCIDGVVSHFLCTCANTQDWWWLDEALTKKNDGSDVPAERLVDIETDLKWLGRTYIADDRHYFNWTNSGFDFNINGTGATALMTTNCPTTSKSYLKIYVDGVNTQTIHMTSPVMTVTLAENLTDGPHNIKVIKRTNGRASTAALKKLWVDEGTEILAPNKAATRKIQFLGDSITVGYGSMDWLKPSAWSTDSEDGTITYAALATEYFGADNHTVAISGRGVIWNTGGSKDTANHAPLMYEYTDWNNHTQWNHALYQPDVVVINLGTNDKASCVTADDQATFKTAVYNLIKQVRKDNPNAHIIWAFGAMGDGNNVAANIQAAIAQLKTEGETKLSYVGLGTGTTCLGHPTSAAHEDRAEELIAEIKAVTGWTEHTACSYDETVITAASCKNDGFAGYTCKICGDYYEEVIPADDHVADDELVVDTAPTCGTTGIGHSVCEDCGTTIEEGLVIPATGEHVWATTLTQGDATHYYACTNNGCTARNEETAHTAGEIIVDTAPGCNTTGTGHKDCTACGKTVEEGLTINATGEHVAADELVVDTAPTCGVAGVGHSVCGTCGITMETGLAIPATGNHAWDNGVITKEPTKTETGVKTFTCTLCGKTKTEKIPTTGVDTLTIFKDLKKKDWYVKNGAIDFVYNNGLFSGLTSTEFGPNDNMTRGMFVTVLGRLHGVSVSKNVKTVFSDVAKGKFYTGYVKWANENDIVSGLTATTFGPDENVNREQICAMMVRYCNFANITLEKKNAAITFKDAAKISRFARSAVKACQQGGIVNGETTTGGFNFRPQGNATRAEVATIMMNFAKAYK